MTTVFSLFLFGKLPTTVSTTAFRPEIIRCQVILVEFRPESFRRQVISAEFRADHAPLRIFLTRFFPNHDRPFIKKPIFAAVNACIRGIINKYDITWIQKFRN